MKNYPKSDCLGSSPFETLLSDMRKKLIISAKLDIQIDDIPFHLLADKGSAVISFDNVSDALLMLRKIRKNSLGEKKQMRKVIKIFSDLGITIYLQGRYFGIAGPKSNLLPSTLFNFATSFAK